LIHFYKRVLLCYDFTREVRRLFVKFD